MPSQSAFIQNSIRQMPEGAIFTFKSFVDLSVSAQALAVVISRLSKRGLIQRLSRGRYTKIRESRFGAILPSDEEMLNALLRSDGEQVAGYISGLAAYNRMGLTPQVPAEISIACNGSTRRTTIGKLRVRYVRTNAPINIATAPLLPILDAIRDIKKIPDTNVADILVKIRVIISVLDEKSKMRLADLGMFYGPRVRALTGAIFDDLGDRKLALQQRKSLNLISTYNIGINKKMLSTVGQWGIR